MNRWTLRTPCRNCAVNGRTITDGWLVERNGQQLAYCAHDHYCYTVPRTELGEEPRSVRTRPDIKPGQRARVMLRDSGRCVMCGTADGPLHIGHLVSVKQGRTIGLTDAELWHDENLSVMCEECNLGLADDSISVRMMARVLMARIRLDVTGHALEEHDGGQS